MIDSSYHSRRNPLLLSRSMYKYPCPHPSFLHPSFQNTHSLITYLSSPSSTLHHSPHQNNINLFSPFSLLHPQSYLISSHLIFPSFTPSNTTYLISHKPHTTLWALKSSFLSHSSYILHLTSHILISFPLHSSLPYIILSSSSYSYSYSHPSFIINYSKSFSFSQQPSFHLHNSLSSSLTFSFSPHHLSSSLSSFIKVLFKSPPFIGPLTHNHNHNHTSPHSSPSIPLTNNPPSVKQQQLLPHPSSILSIFCDLRFTIYLFPAIIIINKSYLYTFPFPFSPLHHPEPPSNQKNTPHKT